VDVKGGYTHWRPVSTEGTCAFSNYGALYDGFAEVLTNTIAQQ